MNVEDMDTHDSEDGDEVTAFREITDKLKIPAVRLRYKPKGMRLERYTVDEGQSQAKLFYRYDDEIIRYDIYLNNSDSSLSQKEEDTLVKEFTVENEVQTIEVQEYRVKENSKTRLIANFEYKGVKYQLKGIMETEIFIDLLKDLIYF